MEPRRFELVPEVAPSVLVHLEDGRTSLDPDEDLVEIGIRARDPDIAIAVTLSLDEIGRLRDALTAIIRTPLA